MLRSDNVESNIKATNLGYKYDLKYDKVIENIEILEQVNTKLDETRLIMTIINNDQKFSILFSCTRLDKFDLINKSS
jgi:hypothetical protein